MTIAGSDGKHRCFGGQPGKEFYGEYHDEEWGVPVHDDRLLFENLILEGAQAGLSWETVLRKRDGYRRAFHGFDVERCAAMGDEELELLRDDVGIIRNRLKIYSVRKNALAFLDIQREFGSFDVWLWGHLDGAPPVNRPARFADMASTSPISDAISKTLKKRGMSFVGSTIIYAYMQAIGMTDDHLAGCWKA
ncbi:DNA-3-methyladenine glycosylase I [Parasphingorhabdus flavimaris]|jgi:DNA-3-methyladenine glycosylase I|uniref:DNA-3-methyladenine glycosylase I n=1 Tax=Parasphingorhabdus flavimaris TaxID=266812 RepID=A0ABX2N3L9_9SPHN|nr:DNA-3-methyladenine glycosylase I [Parasphingorhabdus flavimaris]NVD28269.1 DNA-3-methyladenine glycosylase I [Parasphingorhabdus flavimaris]|tara:strand:+ start:23586 stop:24161 length:576 start_codon:yes stop_codon:yes gene_type:complete